MKVRRRWFITILLAALLGLGGALALGPVIRRHVMLQAVTAEDAERRARAWTWWLETSRGGEPRVVESMQRVNWRLIKAQNDAVIDGSAALRRIDAWGWDHQPMALMMREIAARTAGDAAWQTMAVATLEQAPAEFGDASFQRLAQPLLASDHPAVARDMLDVSLRWLSAHAPDSIDHLTLPDLADASPHVQHLYRTWILACGLSSAAGHDIDPESFSIESRIDNEPLLLTEARMQASVFANPNDSRAVIRLSEETPDSPLQSTIATILRYAEDDIARRTLEQRSNDGDISAGFALQARSDAREHASAQQVMLDESAALWRRKLACWRLPRVETDTVLALLNVPVSDPRMFMYGDVLLAEHHLDRETATELAEQWIRSFNDQRKQAGALLAALLGAHVDLLQEAYAIEKVPRVRTIQHLALDALSTTRNASTDEAGPTALVLAHRALHTDDGDFDPDVLLVLLISGHASALQPLTTSPRGDMTRSVQQRAMLTERFVPFWHTTVGRPIGGSERGVQLHFDTLHVLRLLTEHQLIFDEEQRVFTP